jgi:hypothetical protein
MSTWYLGPLGDLRALTVPERGVEMTQVRYGGIHQGLSGARTMDVTGHRGQYTFNYTYLEEEEYLWLEALHYRLVEGPFWLLNPLKKNLLSLQATRFVVSAYDRLGVRLPTGATYDVPTIHPSGPGIPARGIRVKGWTNVEGEVLFDPGKVTPVLPNLPITASVYIGCQDGQTSSGAYLKLDWYTKDGLYLSSTQSSTFTVTSVWSRRSLPNIAVPAGAAGVQFSATFVNPLVPIYLAAPQVEANFIVTPFSAGGAAPEVLVDQLETTSPRFPTRDCTLTLLEA